MASSLVCVSWSFFICFLSVVSLVWHIFIARDKVSFQSCKNLFWVVFSLIAMTNRSRMRESCKQSQKLHVCAIVRRAVTCCLTVSFSFFCRLLSMNCSHISFVSPKHSSLNLFTTICVTWNFLKKNVFVHSEGRGGGMGEGLGAHGRYYFLRPFSPSGSLISFVFWYYQLVTWSWCITLCCLRLCCITLYCITLYCITLYCFRLYVITLYSSTLCCVTVLSYTVLYAAILYHTVLLCNMYYNVIHYNHTVLFHIVLYHTVLCHTIIIQPHCVVSHYTVLDCIVQYYTVLCHCIVSHCIMSSCILSECIVTHCILEHCTVHCIVSHCNWCKQEVTQKT